MAGTGTQTKIFKTRPNLEIEFNRRTMYLETLSVVNPLAIKNKNKKMFGPKVKVAHALKVPFLPSLVCNGQIVLEIGRKNRGVSIKL